MPAAEKKRLGLDAKTWCSRRPETAETEDNSSMTSFEGMEKEAGRESPGHENKNS